MNSIYTDERVYYRFHNKLEPLGEFGEKLWSSVFAKCGMFYVKFSDLPALNGKGPRLQGSDAILPDFDVTGRRRAYVDSKCKNQPICFRIANELRHGIDRKCWESYEAVGAINRQRCILAVLEIFEVDGHEWSGSLLMQTLGKLGKPVAGFSNQDHMVYWPRNAFKAVGTLLPLEMWDLAYRDAELHESVRHSVSKVFGETEPAIQSRMF